MNYISTESLYDSGAHLAHRSETWRSHKYIKREPDGKGGFRYWYPTDVGVRSKDGAKEYDRYSFGDGKINLRLRKQEPISTNANASQQKEFNRRMRADNKISKITRSKMTEDEKRYEDIHGTRAYRAGQKFRSDVRESIKDISDFASTSIKDISEAASSTYAAGKDFLKGLLGLN